MNTALADAPELLNDDPYGDGWICEIDPDRRATRSTRCSTRRGYRALIAE